MDNSDRALTEDKTMLSESRDLAGNALYEDENQAERAYFDEMDASQAQLDFNEIEDEATK